MSECGTPAGYQQHMQDYSQPCTPCRDANSAYQSRYRVLNGQTRSTRVPYPLLVQMIDFLPDAMRSSVLNSLSAGARAAVAALSEKAVQQ